MAQFIGENNRLSGKVTAVNGTGCTVEVDGNTIHALKVNIAGSGEISTLSVRPERVQLAPEPGSLPNVFDAKVLGLIYLGDHIRCRMSCCGDDDFIVSVNTHQHASIAKGDDVRVGMGN